MVAGWILPTAVNALVFGFFVLPSLRGVPVIGPLGQAKAPSQTFAVLTIAVVAGLVLSALQTPLYRLLEGYLLWPPAVAAKRSDHYVRVRNLMQKRLDAIGLRDLKDPTPEEKHQLAKLEADPNVSRFLKRHKFLTAVGRSLLAEQLRYPIADEQVAPTRFGNAIRRFEEYGYDRYRLDSQGLWYELTAAAPKPLTHQIDSARAGVDFFVCLLYGQLLVAAASLASLGAPHPHDLTLVVTAAVLVVLMPVWYRLARANTDDWALAVRALVDLGRKPLAKSVGLKLPRELDREREMWSRYSQMVLWRYDADRAADLDEFRICGAAARHRDKPEDGKVIDAPKNEPLNDRVSVTCASACPAKGKFADAIQALEVQLAQQEGLLGYDNPTTSRTREELASAYLKAGRAVDAIPIFERIYDDWKRVFGPHHPETLRVWDKLLEARADTYLMAGRVTDAIREFKRIVVHRERALGSDDPDTLRAWEKFANAYLAAGGTC